MQQVTLERLGRSIRALSASALCVAGPALSAPSPFPSGFTGKTVGNAVLDQVEVEIYVHSVVELSRSDVRATLIWRFSQPYVPEANLSIVGTDWTVSAACDDRVLAYLTFIDSDTFGRQPRRGAAAFWSSNVERPVPDLLTNELFAAICGKDPGAAVTVAAEGQKGPKPVTLALPNRRPDEPPVEPTWKRSNATPAPGAPSSPAPGPSQPGLAKRGGGSGTGFMVGSAALITNHHVIDGCSTVRVLAPDGTESVGIVAASDQAADLAHVRLTKGATQLLKLRASPADLGDGLVVFGYPLSGVLSSGGVATTGIVSADHGLGDDSTRFQMTVPIQPGNSGGAVLDENANVAGVVVSKLNALRFAARTGDIAQNVNFAVDLRTLQSFLRKNAVHYETQSAGEKMSTKQVVAAARSASRKIYCEP